jgi:hypothetical protein
MPKQSKTKFFEAIVERRFGWSTCFLCGRRLTERNRRDEHVFPKWLQRRYRLWDEKLILLNRTTIPYRKLTTPCCADCNSKYLEPIEKTMSGAVRAGPRAVRALDPYYVFIWLGKIFYGVLYRELFLPWDRAQKQKGSIVPKWLLKEEYSMHHLFLQSVRVPMRFANFLPASILILETEEPKGDPTTAWDFNDNPATMFIGCRMGKVGLICVLQDGGAQEQLFFPHLKATLPAKLHPVQFREVMAKIRYQGMLFNRIPKYIITEDSEGNFTAIQQPLQGYNRKPLFDPWDQAKYAEILSAVMRRSIEDIFRPPDLVRTWLTAPNGRPVEMPLKRYPLISTI